MGGWVGHRPDSQAGCQSKSASHYRISPKDSGLPLHVQKAQGRALHAREKGLCYLLRALGSQCSLWSKTGQGQALSFGGAPFIFLSIPSKETDTRPLRVFHLLLPMNPSAFFGQTVRVLQYILFLFLPWLPGSSELNLELSSCNPPLPTFLVVCPHFLHLWLLHFRELA